ncbi:cation-transporting ATPase [Candidatus Saccharibacteria bacterium]|nr:MAG: cation-transporting ATPase [Candidatus Saccharibacteria bacterium]
MRDYLDIFKRNLLVPVVIGIYLLAVALLFVNQYRDAWFVSTVITLNVLISIVQEIRAKRVLKKLELMSQPKARVMRDGEVVELAYDKLVVDDEILLQAGDELPADADLISSKGLEVNESMLTGESAAVEKQAGDVVLAATTVVAGSGRAKVTAVGDDTKAGIISKKLKRYSPQLTPLQSVLQRIISWLTYGAIAVALLIFVTYYLMDQDAVVILKTITSAAVTIVPEGLLLASSLLLAFGSLRLAKAKVLPQKLSAIEAMALLRILAVDKTGTLTNDQVTLEKVVSYSDVSEDKLGQLAALVAQETSGGNITGQAILDGLSVPDSFETEQVMAFSSARKTAGVKAKVDGQTYAVVMGAPEIVSQMTSANANLDSDIREWTDQGLRVLLVAAANDPAADLKTLSEKSAKVLGVVILRNSLREGVVDTVDFLQDQGVDIRVISGDNPRTVQFIAGQAKINDHDKVITGASLAGLSQKQFAAAADEYTIFARVLPEQKQRLVEHFRSRGLFTGMVGDGVNDALALKQSDLGVAMFAGAPATRRVADLILLNNSFTSLPMGMRLGNKIMQAIEVIATLFFHKIIYGLMLLLATMVLGMTYPFLPRHITFMNMFLVSMPTVMWTLFPPVPSHRVNPRNFFRDTLRAVTPIALVTGLTVAFTYWIMTAVFPNNPVEVATMTVLTATFFGVYLVFLVGPMLGVKVDQKAKVARLAYLGAVIFVAVTSFGIGPLREFFDFSAPNIIILWPAIAAIALAAVMQWQMAKQAGKKFKDRIN